MIALAKEGGMKFYGPAVNLYNPRSMGIMEAMNICDSKWKWEGGECVEITEGEIDREKFENEFPGYEGDIHGITRERHGERTVFRTLCIKK